MSVDSMPFQSREDQPEPLRYEPETPFTEAYVFEARSPEEATAPGPSTFAPVFETPFASQYYGEAGVVDREAAALSDVVSELYDAQFEEAVADVAQEAAARYAEQISQLGESETQTGIAEQLLGEWLDPLRQESEKLFDSMARTAAQVDPLTLSEDEVDRLFEALEPQPAETVAAEPVFEGFLKGLWNKAKRIVKGAVSLAKRGVAAIGRILPIGALLDKLKQLAGTLLRRVLRFALDRLPASVRPLATTLAKRLFGETELTEAQPDTQSEAAEEQAVPDPAVLGQEFDLQAASLLLAADEREQELVLGETTTTDTTNSETPAISELDDARARFVQQLGDLQPGQDPTPALEEFLPTALLFPVRLGLKLFGRQKVVNLLARVLGPIIARFVPQSTTLAPIFADIGLSLLGLEVPAPQESPALAGTALTGLVEDAVRHVARLNEEELEDPVRVEAAVLEALNQAAAGNMPPALLRPDLPERETSNVNGTWVLMPRPRQGRRRYRYKKFTQAFDFTLTPQMARAVKTFGGLPVEAVLRHQLHVPLPVQVRGHLYEAIPGTWLSRIARLDKAPGLRSYRQLFPLTPEAAGILLQQPGLGRTVDSRYLSSPYRTAVGQRFIYLEILGRALPPAGVACTRPGEVNVTFDLRPGRDETRVAVYLPEESAQDIAGRLQRRELSAAFNLVKAGYQALLRTLLSGQPTRHLRVLSETVPQEAIAPAVSASVRILTWLGSQVASWVVTKLLDYLAEAVSTYFKTKAEEFIAAAREPVCGVTVIVTVPGSPLQTVLRRAISGQLMSLAALADLFRGTTVVPTVVTRPGFYYG